MGTARNVGFFGKQLNPGESIDTTAVLWPEPKNRHDKNAVAVYVQSKHVGYLSREDAAQYSPVLTDLVQHSLMPEVPCKVRGYEFEEYVGTNRRGEDIVEPRFSGSASVVLDAPHLCVPANLPPSRAHVVLPYGSAIQVSGDGVHLDAITPILGPQGECWSYVTLHPITEHLTRSTREVLEIRLDGSRVGQLSPKMSGEVRPAVDHLEGLGHLTAARALITGNRLTAQIKLYAARAHQLDVDWPGVEPAAVTDSHPPELAETSESVATATDGSGSRTEPSHTSDQNRKHTPIPPKPTRIRFNPPPGWPDTQDGVEPPPGWMPPADWPVPPEGWQFWVSDHQVGSPRA